MNIEYLLCVLLCNVLKLSRVIMTLFVRYLCFLSSIFRNSQSTSFSTFCLSLSSLTPPRRGWSCPPAPAPSSSALAHSQRREAHSWQRSITSSPDLLTQEQDKLCRYNILLIPVTTAIVVACMSFFTTTCNFASIQLHSPLHVSQKSLCTVLFII